MPESICKYIYIYTAVACEQFSYIGSSVHLFLLVHGSACVGVLLGPVNLGREILPKTKSGQPIQRTLHVWVFFAQHIRRSRDPRIDKYLVFALLVAPNTPQAGRFTGGMIAIGGIG